DLFVGADDDVGAWVEESSLREREVHTRRKVIACQLDGIGGLVVQLDELGIPVIAFRVILDLRDDDYRGHSGPRERCDAEPGESRHKNGDCASRGAPETLSDAFSSVAPRLHSRTFFRSLQNPKIVPPSEIHRQRAPKAFSPAQPASQTQPLENPTSQNTRFEFYKRGIAESKESFMRFPRDRGAAVEMGRRASGNA